MLAADIHCECDDGLCEHRKSAAGPGAQIADGERDAAVAQARGVEVIVNPNNWSAFPTFGRVGVPFIVE